jgi:hypothetical protein
LIEGERIFGVEDTVDNVERMAEMMMNRERTPGVEAG